MISVRRAFSRHTTTEVILEEMVEGHWDNDNQWVEAMYNTPRKIRATPLPQGDADSNTFGEELEAQRYGERAPAFMKFLSTSFMPQNSRLTVYGITYKVTRVGDYSSGGYYSVVATAIPR